MLVKQLQNALSFAVCVYTTYNVYRYNTESVDLIQVIYACRILYTLPAYLCFDLCINYRYNAFDAVIFTHHICGIIVCLYKIQVIDIAVLSDIVITFGATEISTVFLIIRSWLTELSSRYKKTDTVLPKWLSIAEPVNNILFIGSFTYFRIYLFSKTIIFSSRFETDMSKYRDQNPMFYYMVRTSIYFMYALNIYWFSLILKSLSRSVKGCRFLSARNCEWALQYTYTLSLIYAVYRYSSLAIWNPVYWFDIFGYQLVSISSWLFHGKLYRDLVAIYPNTKIDTLDSISLYLLDIACINARTWLTSYTQYRVVSGYLTSNGATIITTLAIVHTVSFGLYSWYICDMKNKKQAFEIGVNDYRTTIVNIIVGFPIVLNVLYQLINNYNNFYNGLSLFVNIYVCGVVMFIKPFYQANHLALHLLLLWMSVTLVRNNIPMTNV